MDACFPDSVMGFLPYEGIADVRFVKYCFDILQQNCKKISQGAAQDNLSWEKLSTILFPAPPIEVQTQIADILSTYDNLIENNKKQIKLLEEAAQVLGLKTPPRVIESYDISNWGDGSSVCGMVVFKDGKPYRAGYRRFKMKTVAGTDDYASLAETLSRRAAEYEMARRGEKPDGPQNQFATLPDLLLIDGGRGQVGAVRQALRGTALEHVPTFGMVKDDHHRTRAIVDDAGGEIAINRHRNIFTFVTNIQDETHRYANDYRKRMMHKKSYAATLTELPGVGPKTSAALLAHFKTVTAVKQASISDLEEVKGISHAKAENIYNALRQ